MQEKIIELKRVQSILSRPTKHDKPPGIGLNAFLPPNCQVVKTEGNNALPGPSGDLFVEIFAKTITNNHYDHLKMSETKNKVKTPQLIYCFPAHSFVL